MNIKKFSISFTIIIILTFLMVTNANADTICSKVILNDISPSSIGIDEEFTIGFFVDNCGDPSLNMIFELIDISPYLQVKNPLRKVFEGEDYSYGDRFLVYNIRTAKDSIPGNYDIKYKLTVFYSSNSPTVISGSIPITVNGDEAELSIASLKINPVLPKEGETVELTIRIENPGSGTAKSVEVYVDHPFQGLKQSFIGALDSNEDGPAILTFIVDESGEFQFPVTISYKDDFGDNEIKTNVNFTVLEKPSNIGAIIFTILIIAVLGWGVYYFLKTKKSKDKIIQQLLKGNGLKEKDKNN